MKGVLSIVGAGVALSMLLGAVADAEISEEDREFLLATSFMDLSPE